MGKIVALAVVISAATVLAGGDLNLPSHFPNRSQETAPESDCVIKGNISHNSGRRIYHMPGQEDYADQDLARTGGEIVLLRNRCPSRRLAKSRSLI